MKFTLYRLLHQINRRKLVLKKLLTKSCISLTWFLSGEEKGPKINFCPVRLSIPARDIARLNLKRESDEDVWGIELEFRRT